MAHNACYGPTRIGLPPNYREKSLVVERVRHGYLFGGESSGFVSISAKHWRVTLHGMDVCKIALQ